jgi:hypothetical protein
LRREAPNEAAAIDAAARRLARTLAAPEFRNLEARRRAAAEHLGELDRRLGALREGNEAATLVRAADPAAMAHVSLRPVREDLAAADVAVAALVRTLGGGVPSATVVASVEYDESRREVAWEVRHAVAGAPHARLVRIETRAFRNAGRPGRPLSLTYAAEEEPPSPVPSGDWLELGRPARTVSLVAAWVEPATLRPIHSMLRPLAFERLDVVSARVPDDALVATVLDGHLGIEIPLAVALPPPSLARVTVPRHALYFAGGPGTSASGPAGDTWAAADGPGSVAVDLVPRTLLLRNQALVWLRAYVYRPNGMTLTVIVGLAALTLLLAGRRRAIPPATR